MSALIPSREPAWAGLATELHADFPHAVSPAVQKWISGVLVAQFALTDASVAGKLRSDDNRMGHFRIASGAGEYVVHVKSSSIQGDLSVAAEFADWLASGSVPVAPYLRSRDGHPECLVDGLHVTCTRFVPGRHTQYSVADAAAVGAGLAALHQRAATFPLIREVMDRSLRVAEGLRQTQNYINEGRVDAIPPSFKQSVRDAARDYGAGNFEGAPQCGHGDVSPGNVILTADGRAVFCDFEDSAFCYRPITFDLAMAALRFALEGGVGPDKSAPDIRLKSLVGAYDREGHRISEEAVRRSAAQLSRHFLLVLAHLAGEGLVLEDGEWNKACRWRDLAGVYS